MKYAYNRFVRPNSNSPPNDPDQGQEIPGLVVGDCPEDSYEPMLAVQESERVTTPLIPGLPLVQDPLVEFEVEKILRGRYKNHQLEYLVKWKNYLDSQNSWEPKGNLNQPTLEYLERNPVKITGKK